MTNNFTIQVGSSEKTGFLPLEQRQAQVQSGQNPYHPSGALPANSPVFVGRKLELKRLLLGLTDEHHPQNTSLIGESRIGKTSLLNQLQQALAPIDKLVCIRCNMQEFSNQSPPQFFQNLIECLSNALNCPVPEQRDDFENLRDFIRALARHYRFVMLMDEFDVMADNTHFDKVFFDNLRSLGDSNDYRFTFCVISHMPLKALCHSGAIRGSRFWNIFMVRTLGLLDKQAKQQLIDCAKQAGLSLTLDEVDITRNCATHPLLLQLTLHEYALSSAHGLPIERDALQQSRQDIYDLLWLSRIKPEIKVLFNVISGQPVSENATVTSLRQHGLLIDNQLFCAGFARGIPSYLIPDDQDNEGFYQQILKNPDEALKKAENINKWLDIIEKAANRLGRIYKATKGKLDEAD